MPNAEHVAILEKGVAAWNQWRKDHPSVEPELSGVDIYGATLDGADLHKADLRHADLSIAHLAGADLSDAKLTQAVFIRANLRGANLRRADLSDTNLIGADLSNADFSGSELSMTVFGDTNLRDAVGLEFCLHHGPSIIDHHTIEQSGTLQTPFLRGCGLPDTYIEYLPSLLQQPILFYSCFISYSTKDQEFAARLYSDLQNKGVRCWFAPHNIQGGKKIHEQIDQAIRVYQRLLLILSEASINSSWVDTEIANARQRELRERRRMLFPIRLMEFETLRDWKCFDADTGKDSAREIREYFIPDFSSWKDHDSYQKAFQRLLADLKVT